MKLLYKLIPSICSFYIGCIGGNMLVHGVEARCARKESEKAHYGPNLKKQWTDYSQSHLERMVNPWILVPASAVFKHTSKKPFQIVRIGPKVDGIEIKFDVESEEK